MKSLLRARGLRVRLGGRSVLRDVSLDMARGSACVLLGRNGSGKSTLLRTFAGALAPDRGRVRVLGGDPSRAGVVRDRVGFVPSVPDLPARATAKDLAKFGRRTRPLWSDVDFEALLDRVGTPLDVPLGKLSRGQALSVSVACALAPQPDLMLLDEPFAGLDPFSRESVFGAFLAAADLNRAGLIVATHDLDLATRLGDRFFTLRRGELRESAGCVGRPTLELVKELFMEFTEVAA